MVARAVLITAVLAALAACISAAPIELTRFRTSAQGATALANALIDPEHFTLVKGSAKYEGSMTLSALAKFEYHGTWCNTSSLCAGKPPGHFLAPFLRNGAVMMTNSRSVGWDGTSEHEDNKRNFVETCFQPGVRLTLQATPNKDGYLRIKWLFSDPRYNLWWQMEVLPSDAFGTFRILVNGVNRAVTRENLFVNVQTLHNKIDQYEMRYKEPPMADRIRDNEGSNWEETILPIEFGGSAYSETTKRVLVKKGENVTIVFVSGEGALYLPFKAITLSSITKCSASAPCGGDQQCCGGVCCPGNVKCCSGMCCSSTGSTCIAPTAEFPDSCCPGEASCTVNGKRVCCPPGQKCDRSSNRCTYGLAGTPF